MRSLSQINADIKEIEAEIVSQRRTVLSLQLLELAGGDSAARFWFSHNNPLSNWLKQKF